ncbi:MAG: polysaccharide biosynthesis/export family protein [Oceanicaulis sp.]
MVFRCLVVAAGLLVAAACGSTGPAATTLAPGMTAAPASAQADPASRDIVEGYRLGSGDRVRVIVFGEEQLSGEFQVDGEGSMALPLIGTVAAGGKALRELEATIVDRLSQGYLNEPRVSLEVVGYRPFYIHGEVEQSGEFPYQANMSVLSAIALAGGYTYRADTRRVFITRAGASFETEFPANQATRVRPGDVVRVPERFF